MLSINFIPSDDAGKDLWAKNFANKLSQFATKYNISATEVADVQLGSANFSYWLNYKNQNEEYNRKLNSYKNELRDGIKAGSTPSILPAFPAIGAAPAVVSPGIFSRLKSLALRIKKHFAYTEADGKDLGITTITAPATDLLSAKPALSIRLIEGGHPEIVWKKKDMDGIELQVDRGQGFEFLAVDNFPNYTDTFIIDTGVTAIWKYKAIFLKKDVKVGVWSDEVKITVTGQ